MSEYNYPASANILFMVLLSSDSKNGGTQYLVFLDLELAEPGTVRNGMFLGLAKPERRGEQ
jgi:hypothetical protein